MALKCIGIIPAITDNYSEELYLRRVAEAELPHLSEALWRELRLLGKTEQDIHRWTREMEQLLSKNKEGHNAAMEKVTR